MTARSSHGAVVSTPSTSRSTYGRWHDAHSMVCWASVTKLFTAAVARSLSARGTVLLDDSAPEMLGCAGPRAMTLGSLVDHTSRLPRVLPEQGATAVDPYGAWTTEWFDTDVLPRIAELVDASGSPPRVRSYSNLGYAVLTRALERATGEAWIDLVRAHVVEPLGLDPSAVQAVSTAERSTEFVRSRTLSGRALHDWKIAAGPFEGAGGLCSTLPTMSAILSAAITTESELSPGGSPHAWEGNAPRYGLEGALLRSGAVVVVDVDRTSVVVAHAVGGLPGHGVRYARSAAARVVTEADVTVGAEGAP